MLKNKVNDCGFAAIILLLVVVGLVSVVTFSMAVVVSSENRINKSLNISAQSYYSAESGIEDAVLRVTKGYNYIVGTNYFNLDESAISQTIDQDGNTTTIESFSSYFNNSRKVKTELVLTTTNIQFHYGVQVGTGGVEMAKTGSTIHGNLYSNGPVIGEAGGNATVTESVIVAGANILDDITVGADAYANNIIDSEIGRDAYYQTISDTTVGGISNTPHPDSEILEMPLSDDDINILKTDAAAIATLDPDLLCSLSDNTTIDGGKIMCPSGFDTNGNDLTLNGTLWIVGDANFRGDIILGSGYGSNSGVIIVDDPDNLNTKGKILIENGVRVCGSAGCDVNNNTYIMLLSTHSGVGDSYAINVRNTANGAIAYSSNGITFLKNLAVLKEVIAKKLVTSNNTDVYYEDGLADVNFTSGPGGGWIINSWNETQ